MRENPRDFFGNDSKTLLEDMDGFINHLISTSSGKDTMELRRFYYRMNPLRAPLLHTRTQTRWIEPDVLFTQFTPQQVAEQLTLIAFGIFARIETKEFAKLAWSRKGKELKAPNITAMVQHSNRVRIN